VRIARRLDDGPPSPREDGPREGTMKHIRHDNTTILTGDDIADAVIEYAATS
jgi:hypothetical protein